ncbi:helix-turn-helix domain-containing protein, partial [Pasteurella multocida]
MSMRLMAQAMSIKVGNPLRKLVLIKLADNANDDGVCFPSYQYIADVCEISKASARNHIDALIEMGLVSKKARKNKDGSSSNLYFLHLDKGMPADSTGMPADSTGGMLRDSTITSHSLEPVNESNTPLPPKGESANADGVPVVENKKQRSLNIDYVGIGKAYNECVMESGKNLPMLADPENLSQE